jgi:uncharacterized protein (TIGR02145 family)
MDYVGGDSTAGRKLKAASGWWANDYNGASGNDTDQYGFSALPGGHGYSDGSSDGSFDGVGTTGLWWSASESESRSNHAYRQYMLYRADFANLTDNIKFNLESVRCLQD